MNRTALLASPLLALTLAACSSTGPSQVYQAPVAAAPAPVVTQPVVPTPAQTTQQALLTTSVANGFVDAGALSRMTAKDSARTLADYDALVAKEQKIPTVSARPTSNVVRTISE